MTRTRTPTPPLPVGPKITFFGLATADNRVVTPTESNPEGIPIFDRPTRFGFLIVIEGRSGASGLPLSSYGLSGNEASAPARADVQVMASRSLGNGSAAVCDVGPLPDLIGGVPGFSPPNFDPASEAVTDAINDFACRFDLHTTPAQACTLDDLGNFAFAGEEVTTTTRQFCSVPAVGAELQFPSGETLLAVQLRDTGGNIGNRGQIIVRVP